MQNYLEPFESGNFFHVYNRANGSERLFFQERNYSYFLNLLHREPARLVDVVVYCLIPNHFHLIVKVKDTADAKEVSEAFRKVSISYAHVGMTSLALDEAEEGMSSLALALALAPTPTKKHTP